MRTRIAIFKTIFILLFFSGKIFSQFPDYHAQLIDEKSGVKTEGISAFLKDRQGFLWILCNSNVQYFDGRQVKLYRPERLLTSLYCDDAGRIWCTSTRKVYRFENEIKGFIEVPLDTANSSLVRQVARWPDGRTVLVRQKDLQYYDTVIQRFVKMPASEKDLEQFLLFQQGVSTNWPKDSVSLFHVARNTRFTLPLRGISRIVTLSDNFVLLNAIRTSSILYKIGEEKPRALLSLLDKSNTRLPLLVVYGAAMIEENIYLLTTNFGLYRIDLTTLKLRKMNLFADGKPLQNEGSMRNIYIDPEGMAFLTHESGILAFHTRKSVIGLIRNFRTEPGQGFSNEANSCLYDKHGNLWIATEHGFTRWNLTNNTFKTFRPRDNEFSKNDISVYAMVYDGENLLVGSASHGLYIFNPETETFRIPVPVSNDSTSRALLKNGSVRVIKSLGPDYYLVCIESSYFRLHKRTYHIEIMKPGIQIGAAFTALPLPNGNLWVGTQYGLYCVDSNFNVLMQAPEQFSRSRHFYSLIQTLDGEIFVGTRGLYKVSHQNGKVDVTLVDSFFTDKVVQILYRDNYGHIWVGTDDGLFRYNTRTKYIQSFNGETVRVKGYHNNGIYVAKDSTVFFCGNYGINYLRPEKIPLQESPVNVIITKFSVNDDDSSYNPLQNSHWSLSHSEQSVAIEYAAPYYENAFKPLFRYKLQGVDNRWMDAGNTGRVRYSSLPPGEYAFKVAASADGLHWYENKIPLTFTIGIPWWQTWWFGSLLLLLAIGAGIIIYLYRMKVKREKEVRKMIDYFANSGYEHSSVDDILWDIARNCISRLNFEDCVIYLLDDEREVLVQKAAYGPKSPKAFEIKDPIEIPLGQGIVGSVAKTGKSEIVRDTTRDNRYIVDDKARASEITVPIIHEGNVIAIIDSEHRKKNFFKAKHIQVLQTIANLCSAKISRGMALDAMRKSKLQLMELNMKIAESKFLNLRLQMNPHFLFNSLSSIQHLVVSQQTARAYKYLTVFSNLLRSLLQYAEANFISLDREMAMLRMYLDLETLRFDESFHYTIDVDESLEQEEVLLPSLMVQPFAENAIWHGLMHKEGDKQLHIFFNNHHDDYLTCIIDDNGIGRKSAGAIRRKNISTMAHESKGIRIIEERLSLLQKKTGKRASVEIIDKMDELNAPAGTRVVITIPFYNKEEV